MRISPISQNNQSFKAVNQKYYKQAQEWIKDCNWVSCDIYCRLRYDIMLWKEIPVQDGIDTLLAIKKLLNKPSVALEEDLKLYQNLLKKQSK